MDSESRDDPRQYHLSQAQLAYLLDQDIGSRKGSNLDEELEEVAQKIDERIQHLFEDIALLYSHGYLTKANWTPEDIDRTDDLFDTPVAYQGLRPDQSEYILPALHLGHVLRLIYKETASEFNPIQLAVAVLMGLNGGLLRERLTTPSSLGAFGKQLPDDDEYFESFRWPSKDTIQNLETLLSDLDESILMHPATETEVELLQTRLQDSPLTLTDSLYRKAEATVDNQNYPATQSVVDNIVSQLEDDPNLLAIEELSTKLETNIETLQSTDYRKVLALDVFYAVFTEGPNAEKGEIAEAANSKQHQVSKFLNDFTGERAPWTESPIVRKEQIGYSTTQYGTLIGELLTPEDTTEENTPDESPYTVPTTGELITALHTHLYYPTTDKQQERLNALLDDFKARTQTP